VGRWWATVGRWWATVGEEFAELGGLQMLKPLICHVERVRFPLRRENIPGGGVRMVLEFKVELLTDTM